MSAHIHAALMAEYAKDALETNKPWERWQFRLPYNDEWYDASSELAFSPKLNYRRKNVPLCQIEGRDVLPGDKLWWKVEGRWITAVRHSPDTTRGLVLWDNETWYALDNLSWTEPARTKTVYQWAGLCNERWVSTTYYYATEQEVKERAGYEEVRRLDYTALEVPA